MLEFFQPFIEHLTVAGLFVAFLLAGLGVPIPEDAILITGGILSHEHLTSIWWAGPILYLGVVIGDLSIYGVGRRFGHRILRHPRIQPWVTPERQGDIAHYFVRYGNRTVFLARHFACLRAPTYLMAGTMQLPLRAFILWDALGALTSVPLMIWLGYFFAEHRDLLFHYLHRAEYTVEATVVVGVGSYLLYQHREKAWYWLHHVLAPSAREGKPTPVSERE